MIKIINRFLPIGCYSPSKKFKPIGIVQHYFSNRYRKPEVPYNVDDCINLFIELKVSAHFLIQRDNPDEIIHLVPEGKYAYHAGVSSFAGMKNCNSFMFGIETIMKHEDSPTHGQYLANAFICSELMDRYNIEYDHIVGHSDIAPGRKKDPGPNFDFQKLFQLISDLRA